VPSNLEGGSSSATQPTTTEPEPTSVKTKKVTGLTITLFIELGLNEANTLKFS
jgi:hypothetical protein